MITTENSVLNIIDIQGKLAQIMYNKERLFENLQKIIKGAIALEIPILWAEQIPDKLGPTIPEIRNLLRNSNPIVKKSFSCWGEENFITQLKVLNRTQILVAGIETHVCVYQSVKDFAKYDYQVHVISDAVSSRASEDREIGLNKMKEIGANITSVETILFEFIQNVEHPKFKEIIKIIK